MPHPPARLGRILFPVLALTLAVACDEPRPGGDAGTAGSDGGGGSSDGGGGGGDAGPGGGCNPAPLACAAETITGVPVTVTGRTDRGAVDEYGGSTCGASNGGMGGGGAMDFAYEFTAPEAGRYEINTVGSTFDTLLSIRAGCGMAELACNDDIGRGMPQSELEIELEACQTILIVVDGYNAMESGAFQLEIKTHESACGDSTDNDGDGLTDCADPDCFSLECNGGDDWPMDYQAFEWEVLTLTNEARAAGHNCDTEGNFGPTGPLEMDTVIREAARGHALDMGQQDYFMHDSLDGRSFSDRMRDAGFAGDFPWGENIAAGQSTPREVVDGWLESDGHCANIMNPAYHVIGIGYTYVDGSRYGEYWVQDFAASH
ncbi:MAG: CAP domain-containing protein [Sandaracinaceae bacterium]